MPAFPGVDFIDFDSLLTGWGPGEGLARSIADTAVCSNPNPYSPVAGSVLLGPLN